MYVEEKDRAWTSSSGANDHQAITIEVSNSATQGEWPVSDRAFAALIDLCVCICRRNNIPRLVFDGTPNGSLTHHQMFAATNCPGPFLLKRFPQICDLVNERLGAKPEAPPAPQPTTGRTAIAGSAVATAAQMRAYIQRINPNAPDLADLFISEGMAEGIRGDIAFAQSCLETGNFQFIGGTAVTLCQNNFCGMGVVQLGVKGNSYATPRDGIRAQIQHLKAYANDLPLVNPLVTPTVGEARFRFVQRGVAPFVEWLGQQENPQGRGWATGAGYGEKILRILAAIIATNAPAAPQPAQTTPAPQTAAPASPLAFKVGDIVQFTGGGVYTSSTTHTPAHNRDRSRCKVTQTAPKARNQYHLISEDSGRVHGWVVSGDVTPIGSAAAPARKTNEEIAREVINGKWGNGADRVNRLTAAGYVAADIQAIVNRLLR